jgi:predicted nucleic acid-binding protein
MPAKVVDASALVALLFGEAEGAAIAERLRDAGLIAPALLPLEIANACIKKMRRQPDQRDALIVAFGMLDRMEVGIVEVDHDEVLGLADRSGLTAYDASYLWLARRMSYELVTLDRRLAAVAGATDRLA